MTTVTPADLLFYAEEVRALTSGPQVAERADLIARYLERQAQNLLLADLRATS